MTDVIIYNQKKVLEAVKELVRADGRHYFLVSMVAKKSGIEESELWNDEDDCIFRQLEHLGYLIIQSHGAVTLDPDCLC
jgi:hypothetical protein